MKILILAEQSSRKLKSVALELLQASQGHEVKALVFGSQAKPAAEALAEKCSEVFWVSDAKFDFYHSEAYAKAAQEVIEKFSPELVLGTASALGKDLLPKIAARQAASVVADCTAVSLESGIQLKKPFFAGKALAEIEFQPEAKLKVVSLRPNSLVVGDLPAQSGSVTELAVDFDFANSPLQFVEKKEAKSTRPDLTEASVVVSGGRSLKSKENFSIIFELADALRGAAGASRAAVDEGLAPHEMQVGQTGKTVNPKLYIACGISGAIQHLAGMRTSKVIVAINKDPDAPIFSKADYGLVGDLFELVPAITQEIKKSLA
ncbi:MAG: electron transfer flavoprotein subunit alpha/FixB family protein [Bradymonadales bacterium]|nr:MAG: electron transfer flavoprotein subunit alpha/FixB family protein [Bradymonadales bacterium]